VVYEDIGMIDLDHVGASAGGSRADGVDLSWFFALNPPHFPTDFALACSNLKSS